jgi:PST family polysaccharide transporter
VLIALVSNQSIVFIFLLFLFKKHRILNELFVFSFFDKYESKKLLYYSLMTITSAIATPLSLILIRNKIIEKCGIEESGIWQATWYISSMHLMVITTTLSVYYLPKLSSIKDERLLRKEIFSGFMIIIPFVIFSSSFIFLMKDYIVNILFTPKFSVIKDLLLFQMIGDVIKISSWLLSYIMVAKAMTKVFIFTEIFFNAIFVLLSFLFVTYFGLIGMTYSYLINYVLYFVFLLFVFRKLLF